MNPTPNQTNKPKRTFRRAIVALTVGAALVAGVLFYGNRAVDYFLARNFTPSSEVATIHDALQLTSEASDMFYASQPQLQTGTEFNNSCQSAERTAAILGCYYQRRIYIYDVTNEELAKAEDVTAAHELLHGAYERLNFIDKSRVDSLLTNEYAKLKDNEALKKQMEYYQQAEPEALVNELHSIIGTTVADLSPELEQYYARYFKDRQRIVAMNNEYTSVFTEVEKRASELSEAAKSLKSELDTKISQFEQLQSALESDILSFNSRAASGYYDTQSSFLTARQALLARINQLNSMRNSINAQVAKYNAILEELNQLSVRVNELNSSINGITDPEVSL